MRGEDGQVRPCKASRQVFECVVRSMGQVTSRVQEALRHACVQVDAPQIRTLPGRALANWPTHRRPLLARGAAAWARASQEVEGVWFCMGMHTFMNCPSGEGSG